MCGIAGIVALNTPTGDARQLVERIIGEQYTRGPDASGIESVSQVPPVIFGHNRLSIIDLRAESNQPFWSGDRRFVITYNGEIYNYLELRAELQRDGTVFRTNSDTEVLVEAFRRWGPDALTRCVGMFAFALLDRESNTLYMARDRFGKKPFFLVQRADTLAWASSSGSLARHFGLPPSLEAIAKGIRYRVYDDTPPLYQGMLTLRPGHLLTIPLDQGRFDNCIQIPYYDLAKAVQVRSAELAGLDDNMACERIDALLSEAVSNRLRADVPIGVSLSGGLDSSAVAALAAESQSKVVGFSFGHPDAQSSEGPVVAGLVKKLGIQVKYVWPKLSKQELQDLLLNVLDAQDGPIPSTSMMAQYLVYQCAHAHSIRVILGGQGGDEAFMGYRKFQILATRDALRERRYADAFRGTVGFGLAMLNEGRNLAAYMRAVPRYLNKLPPDTLQLPDVRVDLIGRGSDARQRQLLEFSSFSLPSLLRYEDRNSMGHSVESRLPFMDHRVVEAGLALPTGQKIRNGYGKWILRCVMNDRLPDSITWARYKRGFDETQGWIASGLGEVIRSLIKDLRPDLSDVLAASYDPDTFHSDAALLSHPQAFGEATSLIWLGRHRRKGV